MNIEDLEIIRIRINIRDREFIFKKCRKVKKLSRGNLEFEKFSYFENTNFGHKSAFYMEL